MIAGLLSMSDPGPSERSPKGMVCDFTLEKKIEKYLNIS